MPLYSGLSGPIYDNNTFALSKYHISNAFDLRKLLDYYHYLLEHIYDGSLSNEEKKDAENLSAKDTIFFTLAEQDIRKWDDKNITGLVVKDGKERTIYRYATDDSAKISKIAQMLMGQIVKEDCLLNDNRTPAVISLVSVIMKYCSTDDFYDHLEEVTNVCVLIGIPCKYEKINGNNDRVFPYFFPISVLNWLNDNQINNIKDITECNCPELVNILEDYTIKLKDEKEHQEEEEEDESYAEIRKQEERERIEKLRRSGRWSKLQETDNIDELELSVRSYNCLKRIGVETIQDLINKTPIELFHARNMGRKSYEEIVSTLAALGYHLKEE